MMSLLAIVTFDLHGASAGDYANVKEKLRHLKLIKRVKNNSGKFIKLPSNTFVARFRNARGAKQLRYKLHKKISNIMRGLNLKATIFVVVGSSWAWGKKSV